jgi:hypothetical protein
MRLLPLRRILFVVAAFAVVLIYLIWWVSYAGIHYTARYTIRSPGASGEVQGTTVRVLSLTRSDQLADAEEGEPDLPYPGAVWVVAELEALWHDPAKEYYCGAQLIGPERRLWSTSSSPTKRAMQSCPLDLVVGQPVRFEAIYMVPARYADQISGIALSDSSTAARVPVITPPPG